MYREASANVFENTPLCQQWLRHFGYDASDRLTLEKRLSACLAQAGNANSTYSTWTFDAAGQVTNVATKKSNDTLILSMAYTRDNVGNPTQITDQLLLPDNQTWEAGSWTFGYDNTNRLTLEKRTGAHPYWYEYALDGAGNRTQFVQKDGDGNVVGTTNATYSADNRLLTYGNTSYTWDQNGNQLTKTTNQVTVTMGWDYDNKLVLLTDGATLSFTYNGGGLRQSKTADGTTTRFLYDGVRLLAETDANGTITRSYTLAPIGGEWYPLVSDRSGAASRWYAFDALGTTRALTDHSQLTTHQFTDDAWGNVLAASDPAATPHQYIGRYGYYANGTSGLMLLTQRYYDGGVGRFASEDPVREGAHWARYGDASPTTGIDPSGRSILSELEERLECYHDAGRSCCRRRRRVCPQDTPRCRACARTELGSPTGSVETYCRTIQNLLARKPALPDPAGAACILKEMNVRHEVDAIAQSHCPEGPNRDKCIHCMVSCELTTRCGLLATVFAGWCNELRGLTDCGRSRFEEEDLRANERGRQTAMDGKSCVEGCSEYGARPVPWP